MSIQSSHTLKQLTSRRERLKADIRAVEQRQIELAKHHTDLLRVRNGIEIHIQKLTTEAKEPIVTEHAILRYLERVKGVNLAEVRAEILTPKARAAIDKLSTCKVNTDGFTLIVKDRTVVSVEPLKGKHAT